jgi:hypothetical protein
MGTAAIGKWQLRAIAGPQLLIIGRLENVLSGPWFPIFKIAEHV